MKRIGGFLLSWLVVRGYPVLAAGFDRPIPQAQSATAELWFALASIALCVALYVVHRTVNRRR